MMVQIARGVCYLHGRGVAHRDLKPQNVVVSRMTLLDGESQYCVKLVDFGMSKIKVEASKVNTMSALGIGTTRYRAPEVGQQAHPHGGGRAAWLKADIYSFAMTCAHLLSLKTPFEEMQATELHTTLMNGGRPSLQGVDSKEIVALLEDCWNTRAESRPTFKEVCTRLEKVKYALLMEFVGGNGSDQCNVVGYDFIEKKGEEQPSHQDEYYVGELQILTCPLGHALQFVPLPASWAGCIGYWNICWEDIGDVHDKHYRCAMCEFDIHPHCSRLEVEVNVFFHRYPLHLLIQNYYNGNSKAMCCTCEEQVQHSEWVYWCEACDIDVHALCTKLREEKKRQTWHEHPLIMKQCPPNKTLSCASCNGEVGANSWMYTCRKRCTFYAHPSCTLVDGAFPPCVFDNAHKLSLINSEEGFYCNSCGGFGFSWFYHCKHCDVNMHLDCEHNMVDEDNWDEVYEEFKAQHMTKDNHIEVDKIVQLLDQLIVSDNLGELEGSTRTAQPILWRLATSDTLDLSAVDFDDMDLRKRIVAETVERKAKRLAAKTKRVESTAKHLKTLENVERMVLDIRSSESVLQGDRAMLGVGLARLKTRKHIVEDDIAMLVQSKMRHGPRTCLFYQWDNHEYITRRKLLTKLQADMKGVRMMFLCEEPGHQHVMDDYNVRLFHGVLEPEEGQKVQALLGRGLEVVARVVTASAEQLTQLDCVTLSDLGSKIPWDLGAIDVEKIGKPLNEAENVDALNRAEDSAAEWILSMLEKDEICIFKSHGLLRVRYKESKKGDSPGYTRGLVAWLCKEHVHRGLEAGILESYPVKYYNPELN